jgi:SAM-dependent methyltransferase
MRLPEVLPNEFFGARHSIRPNAFDVFAYSKKSHNASFLGPLVDHETASLKDYQDSLCYTFISDNVPAGSRILEIGGGDSRVIRALCERYFFTNLDPLDGSGNGLVDVTDFPPHVELVRAHLGDFSPQVSTGSYDFAFSISVLEHVSEAFDDLKRIIADLNRVLAPGAFSLHAIDARILPSGKMWIHEIIPTLESTYATHLVPTPEQIAADPDLYVMSEAAYRGYWEPVTKRPYSDFGLPLSINLLCQHGTPNAA